MVLFRPAVIISNSIVSSAQNMLCHLDVSNKMITARLSQRKVSIGFYDVDTRCKAPVSKIIHVIEELFLPRSPSSFCVHKIDHSQEKNVILLALNHCINRRKRDGKSAKPSVLKASPSGERTSPGKGVSYIDGRYIYCIRM